MQTSLTALRWFGVPHVSSVVEYLCWGSIMLAEIEWYMFHPEDRSKMSLPFGKNRERFMARYGTD